MENKALHPEKKCHHLTMYRIGEKGFLMMAVHCGSFGEPNGTLDIWFNAKPGHKQWSLPSLSPEDAIVIAEQIIARAKQARAEKKRWERRQVPGTISLKGEILDLEDEGAELSDAWPPEGIEVPL